ncbi:MAG: GNAT family N-acetyltransferase [Candidatus Micrarchaeia archaeon]
MNNRKSFKIVRLRNINTMAAIKLYMKGLSEERPKGHAKQEELAERFKLLDGFGALDKNRLVGIITFTIIGSTMYLDFIFASIKRHRIGFALMLETAKLARRKHITLIKTSISKIDQRSIAWYKACGYRRMRKTAQDWPLVDRPFLFYADAQPDKIIKAIEQHEKA